MSLQSSYRYFGRFFYILADKRKKFILLVFVFLFLSLIEAFGIGLVGPFMALAVNQNLVHQNALLQSVYDQIGQGPGSEKYVIAILGIGIVTILSLKSVLVFLLQKQIFKFGFGMQAGLRMRLISTYLKAPYTFHLKRNTASAIQHILGETGTFANGFLMPLLTCSSNLLITCALIILLAAIDVVATLSVSIGIGICALVLWRFRHQIAGWGKACSLADAEIARIVSHSLGGFKETRVIGCEAYFEQQLAKQAKIFQHVSSSFNAFKLLPRYIIEILLIGFLISLVLFYIFAGYSSEKLTETLGVFGLASIRLIPASSGLMQGLTGLRNSGYIVNQLYMQFKQLEEARSEDESHFINPERSVEKRSPNAAKQLTSGIAFDRDVTIDHLSYTYPGAARPALTDITFTLRKGESIALIGRSGAGKTTLVDVILGLLIPQSGDIKIDDVSYRHSVRAWQDLVGYIPQSIFLIDDTIERNIAFGVADEHIDAAHLNHVIQMAQLSELIDQLPDGVKTQVGERGARLSGGQRQRIGIARALYHQREILVLDEATSALDNETEYLVNEAIKSLSGSKTLIIIAHRLTTVEHCDRIYLMDQGQIVKAGSYDEVVPANGFYSLGLEGDMEEKTCNA
jgi:ATP-binding cassette, subfamily B, bacterial PglK